MRRNTTSDRTLSLSLSSSRLRRFWRLVLGVLLGMFVIGSVLHMDISIHSRLMYNNYYDYDNNDGYLFAGLSFLPTSTTTEEATDDDHDNPRGSATLTDLLLLERSLRAQEFATENEGKKCPLPLRYFHDRIVLLSSSDDDDDNNIDIEGSSSGMDDNDESDDDEADDNNHNHNHNQATQINQQQQEQSYLIPRVFHASFKNRCLPQDLYNNMQRWQTKLPNFSILFHSDDDVDALLAQDWPEFPHLQEVLPCVQFKGAMKIDIWRVLALYKYGGIYTDIDNWPLDKFSEEQFFHDPDLSAFFFSDGYTRPSQWFMAMEPHHPIAYHAMNVILSNVYNLGDISQPKVVSVTGPHAFKAGYHRFFHHQDDTFQARGGTFVYQNKKIRQVGHASGETDGYIRGAYKWNEFVQFNATHNITKRQRVEIESGQMHWQRVVAKKLQNNIQKGSCKDYLIKLEKERAAAAAVAAAKVSTSTNEAKTIRRLKSTTITSHKGTTTGLKAASAVDSIVVDPEHSLAFEQSFGLLNDVTNTAWEELRRTTKTQSWYANPDNPLENIDDAEWWNTQNMLPNFDCPHLEKVGGTQHEGTKFVCNPQGLVKEDNSNNNKDNGSSCLIYSFGCAGDFKFEDAMYKMHNKGCEIHIFDPADWKRPNDAEQKNIHYHAWGLASTYDHESKSVVWPKGRGGGFKTFPETLQLLGHQDRTIDILKIDCEGCEWSSHKDWIGLGIRQILIEMHGVPSPRGTPKARWYQKPMDVAAAYWKDYSDNGYALYSRDPNGALGMELSFIKLHDDFWK